MDDPRSKYGYVVIVTTPSHPKGVSYPASGRKPYTREEAIDCLKTLVSRGHKSDWTTSMDVLHLDLMKDSICATYNFSLDIWFVIYFHNLTK